MPECSGALSGNLVMDIYIYICNGRPLVPTFFILFGFRSLLYDVLTHILETKRWPQNQQKPKGDAVPTQDLILV